MKVLDRALSLRRSTRLHSPEPLRVFRNRLREPRRLLSFSEKSGLLPSTRLEARRQFLTAVTAAMELFWRTLARTSIDRCRPPISALERLKKTTFTLSDVRTIVGRKLSLGELIAASYTFQGTTAVNTAFSEILQINVFSEFAKERFVIVEEEWYQVLKAAAEGESVGRARRWTKKREPLVRAITGRDILKRDCELVDRCCGIRHESVHGSGQVHRVKADETVRISNAVWEFNMVLGMFLESRFDVLWGAAK